MASCGGGPPGDLCTNGQQDNGETGVDCGGECPSCTSCRGPEDCDSQVCDDGTCLTRLEVQCQDLIPENAIELTTTATIEFIPGEGWTTPACNWECQNAYGEHKGACVQSRSIVCDASKTPEHGIAEEKEVTVEWKNGDWEATPLCEWTCASEYGEHKGACVQSRSIVCDASKTPEHGIAEEKEVTVEWKNGDWEATPLCEWTCASEYGEHKGACVQSRSIVCDASKTPEHGIAEEKEVTVEWKNGDWEATPLCEWTCASEYGEHKGACVQSRSIVCDASKTPEHGIAEEKEVIVEWKNGDWEATPLCEWTCASEYGEHKGACVQSRSIVCDASKTPEHGIAEEKEVTVEWKNGDWEATPLCEWTCASEYGEHKGACVQSRSIVCDASKTPEHGIAEEKEVTVEWKNGDWEATPLCEWECEQGYERDNGDQCFSTVFVPSVVLDQAVYSWTSRAHITVQSIGHNFDVDAVDKIAVNVQTKEFDIQGYVLVETGTDTGIFTGSIILTGFLHDADGNPETGDSSGYDTSPKTSMGGGPDNGFLQSRHDDILVVTFPWTKTRTATAEAPITWNVGKVNWSNIRIPADGTATITVKDPDMNLDPNQEDAFVVYLSVVSLGVPGPVPPLPIVVKELSENIGVFEGNIALTYDFKEGRINVVPGTKMTVEYYDHTLPHPSTPSDDTKVSVTALVNEVLLSNGEARDDRGKLQSTFSVGESIHLSAVVRNVSQKAVDYAVLVQVMEEKKDGDGKQVFFDDASGTVDSFLHNVEGRFIWVPKQPGTYVVTIFLWAGLLDPTTIAPPISFKIAVR